MSLDGVTRGGQEPIGVPGVGQVGFDPGLEWGSGDLSTMDNTIRRDILALPDPNIFDPFSLADWTGYPNDTFGGLGYPGGQVPDISTRTMVLMGLIPLGMIRSRARARRRRLGSRIEPA